MYMCAVEVCVYAYNTINSNRQTLCWAGICIACFCLLDVSRFHSFMHHTTRSALGYSDAISLGFIKISAYLHLTLMRCSRSVRFWFLLQFPFMCERVQVEYFLVLQFCLNVACQCHRA